MQLPLPAVLAIDATINTLLKRDDDARARLPALQGKIIQLHIQGLALSIYLLLHTHKIEVMRFFDGAVDATISGTPLSMASLGASNHALFSGEVQISGDVDTGKRFKRLLDTLQIDWEEQLSKVTGDIAAHQIGNVARTINDWLTRSTRSLGADLGEYLREESRVTPTLGECEHFYRDMGTLRADVDRLEARLQRLETHRAKA